MNVTFDLSGGNRVHDSLFDFTSHQELRVTFNAVKNSVVKLNDVITFPGAINAHDHLDLGLFPFLGNRIYKNYAEWGNDIHTINQKEIEGALAIPLALRIRWAILKNLFNGVTAIVHHGGYHNFIKTFNYPIVLNYQYLHAIGTERYWKIKLNTPSHKPVMIHTGEGTDQNAYLEIDQLIKWNLMNRSIIGVHAIAMDEDQSRKFKAVVWCPDSNLKLYGKTARVNALYNTTSILFGTDSTVSSSSNLWEQLRVARNLKMLSDADLYNTLFVNSLTIFPSLKHSSRVVAKRKHNNAWDSFYTTNPEDLLLVVIDHKIMLADKQYFTIEDDKYSLIRMGESEKWIPKEWASVVIELERLGVSIPVRTAGSV